MNILILLIGSNPLPLHAMAKFRIAAGNDTAPELAKIIFANMTRRNACRLGAQRTINTIIENIKLGFKV